MLSASRAPYLSFSDEGQGFATVYSRRLDLVGKKKKKNYPFKSNH